jgi:hypothetical protein
MFEMWRAQPGVQIGYRAWVFLVFIFWLPGCGGSSSSAAPPPNLPKFIVCKSTYALCTTAFCSPIAGNDKQVSCNCIVQTGYSAGLTACQPVTITPEGTTQLVSRYFPIRSYAVCSNSRPWANCVDSPCLVDPTSSSFATCYCDLEQNQGDYLIVNAVEQYNSASCTTGVISSATITQANQLTEFLKFNPKLHPFRAKVFSAE